MCVAEFFQSVSESYMVCLFVCLSASKYHEDERFWTSGFSPVHFRLLEPITQDTLLNLKDGEQGEVKIYLK